ncbi:sulfatase [bacterium]|nr:sulfatase [bacterium]
MMRNRRSYQEDAGFSALKSSWYSVIMISCILVYSSCSSDTIKNEAGIIPLSFHRYHSAQGSAAGELVLNQENDFLGTLRLPASNPDIQRDQDGIHCTAQENSADLQFDLTVHAQKYHTLVVTLKAETLAGRSIIMSPQPMNIVPKKQGTQDKLNKTNHKAGQRKQKDSKTISVIWVKSSTDSDAKNMDWQTSTQALNLHETDYCRYSFSLRENPFWHGDIAGLSLIFGPKNLKICLKEVKLLPVGNEYQLNQLPKLKVHNEIRPVLQVSQYGEKADTVLIPDACTLEFGLAALTRSESETGRSVNIIISVQDGPQSKRQELQREVIPINPVRDKRQEWHDCSYDLDSYAGQRVNLVWECSFDSIEDRDAERIVFLSQPYLYSRLQKSPPAHSFLISIDTLRSDHLGCYGYPVSVSPNLDWLAKMGTQIMRAETTYPGTTPAHTSMLTGLYPFEHNVFMPEDRIPFHYPTLAEYFYEQRVLPVAFTGGGNVASFFGFDRGFLRFSEKSRFASSIEEQLIPWLDKHVTCPYFVFYHNYEVHAPYRRHEVITEYLQPNYSGLLTGREQFRNIYKPDLSIEDQYYITALYDTGVRSNDAMLGKLFAWLNHRKLFANTLLFVLADHGEHLGEHDLYSHGNSLYDPLLTVPMIISFPAKVPAGAIFQAPVNLVDIPATFCGLLDQNWAYPGRGRDISVNIREQTALPHYFSVSEVRHHKHNLIDFGLSDGHYKYISGTFSNEERFFLLPSSEESSDNIYADQLEKKRFFAEQLKKIVPKTYINHLPDSADLTMSSVIDSDNEILLRELGYLE